MSWNYSGDPSKSEKDRYRFLVGDVNEKEGILHDEEIQFIIDTYGQHNVRLYHLFTAAATFFARKIKRTVGPIEEDPIERQRYFEEKAKEYKRLISSPNAFTLPTSRQSFKKGMHDNGRY